VEYAVETNELGKSYRHIAAVQSVNLRIPHGEVFALLGPNGAGKTTLVMLLLGNIHPTSGSAKLLGMPIGDVPTRKRVGFLPEKFHFHDFLTATEFLRLHGRLSGMQRERLERRIPEVLERVGLAESAGVKIREFSKGMQQRIGVGQAILHDPDLILLDEPTSALDPMGRRDIRDLILELRSAGKTVLLNSHLLSEVELTCDRLAILHKGQTAAEGTLKELLSFASTVEVEVEEMNDTALRAVRGIAAKLKLDRVPITRFTAWVKQEEDIPALAEAIVGNGVRLRALVPRRETLEDLYVRVIEALE